MSRVYCTNFDSRIRERDIDFLFGKYGRIEDVMFKPTHAYIKFADERDAADAIHALNRHTFEGCTLRVEYAASTRPSHDREDRYSDSRDSRRPEYRDSQPRYDPRGASSDARYDDRYSDNRPPRYDNAYDRRPRSRSPQRHSQPPRGGPVGGPSAARGGPDPQKMVCFGCQQVGHWARDCPDKANRDKCFNCFQSGHRSSACPEPPRRGRPLQTDSGAAPAAHSRSPPPPPRSRSR